MKLLHVLRDATMAGIAGMICLTGVGRADDESAALYNLTHVPSFQLQLSDDAIATLNTSQPLNDGNRPEVEGTFVFGGTSYDVRVKLKGQLGSFRTMDSKPGLKIKFRGQRFFGVKTLTLNNCAQDHTLVNQVVAYSLYRAAGVPTPRTGYATLRINDQDYGLYLNVETEDKTFLARNFSDATGPLFDGPGWGHDIRVADVPAWTDLEEGDEAEARAALTELARAVETLSPDNLFYGQQSPIDTDAIVSLMAVEILVGDPDAYTTATNNYRLYQNPTSGKWTIIPAGRDRSFETELRP